MTRTPPGIYRHWKGNLYRVLFVALDSNNDRAHEPTVVYLSLDPGPHQGQINVRHESEFHELLPDGTPRFSMASAAEDESPLADGSART